MDHITLITITNSDLNQSHAILGENISDTTIDVHKKYLLSRQKEETQFSMHNKYLLSRQKKETLSLCIRSTLLSWPKKETLFPVQKKHFVVLAEERNTVFYTQEIPVVLAKEKTLFPVQKKHFVVLTEERNTVPCTKEKLCCLGKRKKHCSLCTRNSVSFFCQDNKVFLVSLILLYSL